MNWTIKDIVRICDGKLHSGKENVKVVNFSKDTRTIKKGDIYIGIKGDNFDGNKFYEDAFEKGAAACILEEAFVKKIKDSDNTIVSVKSSIEALKNMAEERIKVSKVPVVAITGSVGKTSTRDMINAVLSTKYKTLVAQENYNNHIGVPLTILRLKKEEILILEMGMSSLGEIEYLSNIAKPDIAVITNVLPVHLESLGSIKKILKAKLEIISGLKSSGKLVINNDNRYLQNLDIPGVEIITCGFNNNSMYKIEEVCPVEYEVNINDEIFLINNQIGTNAYISNSVLAVAVGNILKVPMKDIQKGLSKYTLTSSRLENLRSKKGVTIIDDSYNASTDSMKNAIEYTLKQEGKRKIAILGDINELGNYSKVLHGEVGKYIAEFNVDYLITIGNHSKLIGTEAKKGMKKENIIHFKTKEEGIEFIGRLLEPEDVVLVKASNGNKFIEIVKYIKENC